MKALLILVAFTIQNVLSDDLEFAKSNDLKYKSYKDVLHPKIAIWNSKWQAKKKMMPFLYPKKQVAGVNSKTYTGRHYTAFQPIGPVNVDIPESPSFPIDHHNQQRSRIKKVLPEVNLYLSRVRRHAQNNKSLKKPDDKKEGKTPTPAVKGVGKPKAAAKANTNPNRRLRLARKQGNAQRNKNNQAGRKKRVQTGRALRNTKVKPANKKNLRAKNVKRLPARAKKNLRNNKAANAKPVPKAAPKNQKPAKPLARTLLPKKQPPKPAANLKDAPAKKGARRLISTRDADIEEFPYVVSIQKDSEHWCSGALLNPRLVITTANCVWKSSSVSRMRIRAGSRYTDHGGQKAKIQEVMKHPHWDIRSTPDNDVALLLLDRDLRFSDSVHAADLPNRVMLPPFNDAWVTSWGTERRDGVFKHQETTLQKYHTHLMAHHKCSNLTKRYGVPVTHNFICLAQDGHRAPCTRDTGAPAVSDGILWGLASWSIRKLCGTEKFPAMFSYLGSVSNLEFIMNATHWLMADDREDPFPDHFPKNFLHNKEFIV